MAAEGLHLFHNCLKIVLLLARVIFFLFPFFSAVLLSIVTVHQAFLVSAQAQWKSGKCKWKHERPLYLAVLTPKKKKVGGRTNGKAVFGPQDEQSIGRKQDWGFLSFWIDNRQLRGYFLLWLTKYGQGRERHKRACLPGSACFKCLAAYKAVAV